jgi:hypothetical protein
LKSSGEKCRKISKESKEDVKERRNKEKQA